MADELYVVVRLSKLKADITKISNDLKDISKANDLSIHIKPRVYTKGKDLQDYKQDIEKLQNNKNLFLNFKPRIDRSPEAIKGLQKDIDKICKSGLTVSLKGKITSVEFDKNTKQPNVGKGKSGGGKHSSGIDYQTTQSRADEKRYREYIERYSKYQSKYSKEAYGSMPNDLKRYSEIESKIHKNHDSKVKDKEYTKKTRGAIKEQDVLFRELENESKRIDSVIKERTNSVSNNIKILKAKLIELENLKDIPKGKAELVDNSKQRVRELISKGEALQKGKYISDKDERSFGNQATTYNSKQEEFFSKINAAAKKTDEVMKSRVKSINSSLKSLRKNLDALNNIGNIPENKRAAVDKKKENIKELISKGEALVGKKSISKKDTDSFNKQATSKNFEQKTLFVELKQQAQEAESVVRKKAASIESSLKNLRKNLELLENLESVPISKQEAVNETKADITKLIKEGESLKTSKSTSQKDVDAFSKKASDPKIKDFVSHRVEIEKNAKSYEALLTQADRYLKVNTKLGNNPALVKKFHELRESIVKCDKPLDELRTDLKRLQNEAAERGLTGLSAVDDIKGKAKKFTQWFSISQIVMRATMEVQRMFQEVKNVDTAMVELKKVTNETKQTYHEFLDYSIDKARELGSSVSDLVNATADFARLGYNLSEAKNLAESATIYKNVGDGIENVGTASESIISTMKAFNVEAENSISIVDKFNEVGNTANISSYGIGEALKRSASALSSANNSLDESIGLITAANSVVQDPDIVGTALKTISMRIRGASTDEMEEAGLDVDGMAVSVSKLREEMKALSGVDLMIDDNTFKSTYDIMVELSKVWDTLSDVSQANIIEKIAGKRQGNVVESMMKNMEDGIKATNTAANSTGSALAENEKYLDSISGKISILSATYQAFATDLLDSEALKSILTVITALINLSDKLLKHAGALPVFIGLLTTGLTIFSSYKSGFVAVADQAGKAGLQLQVFGKTWREIWADIQKSKENNGGAKGFFGSIFDGATRDPKYNLSKQDLDGLTKYENTLKEIQEIQSSGIKTKNDKNRLNVANSNLTATYSGLNEKTRGVADKIANGEESVDKITRGMSKASLSARAASVAIGAFGAALTNIAIMLAIAAVVKLATVLQKNLLPTMGQLKDKAKESANEFSESQKKIESLNEELSTTGKRIKELESQGSLTFVEQGELEELKKTNTELEKQLTMYEKKAKIDAKKENDDSKEVLEKTGGVSDPNGAVHRVNVRGTTSNQTEIQTLQVYLNQLEKLQKQKQRYLSEEYSKDPEKQKKQTEEVDKQISELETKVSTKYTDLNTFVSQLDKSDKSNKELLSSWDTITTKWLGDEEANGKAFQSVWENSDYEEVKQELLDLAMAGKLTTDSLDSPKYNEFKNALKEAGLQGSDFAGVISSIGSEAEKTKEKITNLATVKDELESNQGNIDKFKGYVDEYNEQGYLSTETVQKMVLEDSANAQYITVEDGYYKLNTRAINDYNDSVEESKRLTAEYVSECEDAFYGTRDFSKEIVNLVSGLSATGAELDGLNLDVLSEINQSFYDGTTSAEEYFRGIQGYSESVDFSKFKNNFSSMSDGIKGTLETIFSTLVRGIDYLTKQYSSGSISFEEYFSGMIESSRATEENAKDHLEMTDTSKAGKSKGYSKEYKDIATSAKNAKEQTQKLKDETSGLTKVLEDAEKTKKFVEFLNDNADVVEKYADSFGNIRFKSVDSSEYQNFVSDYVDMLREAGTDSSLFKNAQTALNDSFDLNINTVDDVAAAMRGSVDAGNAAILSGCQTTADALSKITSGASAVIGGISELISNFSATIDISYGTPEKFDVSIFGKSLGAIELPTSISLKGATAGNSEVIEKITGGLKSVSAGLSDYNDITAQSIVNKGKGDKDSADSKKAGLAKNVSQAQDSIDKLNDEASLDALKNSIDTVKLAVDKLNDSLSLTDDLLSLTSELNYASKYQLLTDKFSLATQKGAMMRDEFNRLANTTPRNADEAQELANRLEELGSDIRNNIKDLREYRNELDKIALEAISASSTNVMSQLEEQAKVLDYNIKTLTDGSMIGSDSFSFDFLLPEIPEDAIKKQSRENKEIEKEEQRHQDTIFAIKQQALDMAYAQLIQTRAEEKKNLLSDLNESKSAYEGALAEASESTKKTANETGTASVKAFMGNFQVIQKQLGDSGTSFANTFATSFILALNKSQNPISAAISAAISSGISGGVGGVAPEQYLGTLSAEYKDVQSFYANGRNKYGGTHAKDQGIDYPYPAGTPIPAAWAGVVTKVADLGNKSYGKYVIVDSEDGKKHVYAHMSKHNAAVGQRVLKGQIIGFVGSTGKSTGNHLHVSNAWGTYIDTTGRYKGGTVLPNENTLAGEKGRELALLPNRKVVMLGENGAGLYDLPEATKIINHEDTEEVLKHTGEGIIGTTVPKFASGNASIEETFVPKFASGNIDPTWIKLAQQIQSKYGIPSSLVLSQFILESGWGTSSLSKNANNFFGMKGTGTAGKYNGYRKYNSMEESFEDYAKNLLTSGYYKVGGLGATDFNGWISSIAETYAPNQGYQSKVTQLANQYNLTQYDNVEGVISNASEAATTALSAAESAKALVEKYTEIPQAYSKDFMLKYRDYAEARSKKMADIDVMKKLDPERARELIEEQRSQDMQKSYEMKIDMYTNAAEKLKKNYTDLLAEFDKIKNTADVDVLQEYIKGLSEIQGNLREIDETLQEAAHGLYAYSINVIDNKLNLLERQRSEAAFYNDYNKQAVNYQQQIALYEQEMLKATEEANRIRETGASEDSEYIQDAIDKWWECSEAIREYKKELEDLLKQRKESYHDTLQDFQNSYIDIFKNSITDLEHQKSTDPALQALYDQKEALAKINEERENEIALMKAKENLAKLQKTTLVYQKGVGWVYKVDENSLREAKENLSNAQNDYDMKALDKQIEDLEKFYDDQIEKIQKFIDNLEYEMEVYLRKNSTSMSEIMDKLRELGIASADNIQHILEWFENLTSTIANDEFLQEKFGQGSAADYESTSDKYQNDKFYNLIKQMMFNTQAMETADENTKKNLHNDNLKIAETLGLTYRDGIYYTQEGIDAYKVGADLLQQEIQDNKNKMTEADSLQIAVLESLNSILQKLYNSITNPQKEDATKKALIEMVENSIKWHSATDAEKEQLHQANTEIGKNLGLSYNEKTGTWYTDDTEKMEAYARVALEIMKKNSSAYGQTEDQSERDMLHKFNQILGGMFGLVYDETKGWTYANGTKAYAKGGVINYTGLAEVHGGYSSELILNNADVAKLYDYIHNTPNLVVDSLKSITSKSQIAGIQAPQNSGVIYQFGDIVLNGVQHPNELAIALKNELGIMMKQAGIKR